MPHRRPILVTGSEGQLGKAFVACLARTGHVVGVDRGDIDLANARALRRLVNDLHPGLIVNCAAYNDVDGAEAHPLDAFRTNADVVWHLAEMARATYATLVHFSSDFVFNGENPEPYLESDEPDPRSVYGMSKLAGERYAMGAPRHYVLRLASLYGGHTRRTTTDWFIERARAGEPVPAFQDRTVSPSYVPHVVDAAVRLWDLDAPFGLYHAGSADSCTWVDLAEHVLQRFGRPDLLVPAPFANRPDRAPRPTHCALSSRKLAGAIGSLPNWREALDHYLERIEGRVIPA